MFNACRSKKLPRHELELILPQVASLNQKAIEIASSFDVHACTDMTGFGIVGHVLEMAKGSGVRINLFYDKLPFYPNALHMYRRGETTGSNKANRKLAEGLFEKSKNLSGEEEELLFDPQTSGGLLLALPSTHADQLTMELRKAGMETAVQVGEAMTTDRPSVRIV
ncbi:MAG: AIR synthase-related protein [Candidatus Zixiibacteriota bacterium]